ncbi:hypothetical protein HF521_021290 [Silurus meridionalis]|uniref:Uncharacterized protein n=1 Tax=Silurus meridionalis TaxID=175797 RepID=A0A8T0BAR9_SILME|nr:hypothetical protein HF521_021290 [Silurus meridionalis]
MLLLVGGDLNVDMEADGGGELAQVMAGAGLVGHVQGGRAAGFGPYLEECQSNLFGMKETRSDLAMTFLDSVAGKLPGENASKLEGQISLEEVKRDMFSLKTGVAPGGHGLPVEWYARICCPCIVKQ